MKKSTTFKQLEIRLHELLQEKEGIKRQLNQDKQVLIDFDNRSIQPLEERKQLIFNIVVKKELISHFEHSIVSVNREYEKIANIESMYHSLKKNDFKVGVSLS